MRIEIKVPSVGESISEAIVSQMMKPSGSFVRADEEILELETDKVNQVVYSPQDGLLQLTVAVGQTVAVGEVIGSLETEAQAPVEAPKGASPIVAPVPVAGGPPARITPEEAAQILQHPPEKTEQVVTPPPPAAAATEKPVKRRRMTGLRKTIGAKLVAAKNETAMLTTFNEVDMTEILAIRAREQEAFVKKYGVKLGFMSFFVKAAVAALKEFPDIHSFIEKEEIVTPETYEICIAVSTEKGLMVPVLRGCEEKSFGQMEQQIADFSKRARAGGISVEDMRGGSFTISNGGVFGSLLSTPILNPPQSAILGMHTISKRAMVVENEIVIRPMMYLALSYDHRIVDGREAIQFLVHMKGSLEEPTRMLIDL